MVSKNVYVVVGAGSAPKSVIHEGLSDVLKSGDTVAIPWYGTKPVPKGLEYLYDYVLDEEIPAILVAANGVNVPKHFTTDNIEIITAANVNTKLLRQLDGKGAVLVLWDAANEDESEDLGKRIFDTVPDGTLVLELTNGLAPVVLPTEEPEKAPEPDPDDDETEVAPSAFTREELENMPANTLKAMAKKTENGIPDGVIGKVNYIKIILGEELPDAAYPTPQGDKTVGKVKEDAPSAPVEVTEHAVTRDRGADLVTALTAVVESIVRKVLAEQ